MKFIVLTTVSLHLIASSGCKSTQAADEKMIGGVVAKANQYPASINLALPNQFGKPNTFCTGSFISARHILTAAHCVVEAVEYTGLGLSIEISERLKSRIVTYYTGPLSEQGFQSRIRNVYVHDGTIAHLKKTKDWDKGENEGSYDAAVIEIESEKPASVELARLSQQTVKRGTPIRIGGYGCEQSGDIPSSAPVINAGGVTPLKYAQSSVSKVSRLVGYTQTYSGKAKQSVCHGDSGGPVYFDGSPGNPSAGSSELIGVNSFINKKALTEGNFTLVTATSELGLWVQKVVAGSVKPFPLN